MAVTLVANKWQLFVIISRQFDFADKPKTWLIYSNKYVRWTNTLRSITHVELSGKLTANHIHCLSMWSKYISESNFTWFFIFNVFRHRMRVDWNEATGSGENVLHIMRQTNQEQINILAGRKSKTQIVIFFSPEEGECLGCIQILRYSTIYFHWHSNTEYV